MYSVYDVPDQMPDAWVVTSTERFVYDGWNGVLVLDDNNETLRKYRWGLDLSQTIHGAGGTLDTGRERQGQVGGLVAVEETATTGQAAYWYLCDANGNVGQVLKASDQSLVAHYEYDPYGNAITATGTYADANPFRFSTKWLDTELAAEDQTGVVGETGLYYYGYRYYSPHLGRWLGRLPS